MFAAGTRLDATVRIPALEPLRRVNGALVELLDELGPEDWARPTVHRDRDVKDLTAHLLHGSLRRVSSLRDGYRRPGPPMSGAEDLVAFIQQDNREFMTGMRRVSPRILRELVARYDAELVTLFEAMDPDAPGLGVVWAGEWVSPNWFDVAREYTEKWHHQQQIRDATGRPPLDDPPLLVPALETFARGLPFAYRKLDALDGAAVSVSITGAVSAAWTLRREGGAWSLWSGASTAAAASIALDADLAWRLWTKGVSPGEARERVEVEGDLDAADPLLRFVAVMA